MAAVQPVPAATSAISQLNSARLLALRESPYYLQIVPGVLPLIGTSAVLELRRWGADFLAETFATPSLGTEDKTQLALKTLPLLKEYLDKQGEDEWVVKSTVQWASSCYPLIFRYTYVQPPHPIDILLQAGGRAQHICDFDSMLEAAVAGCLEHCPLFSAVSVVERLLMCVSLQHRPSHRWPNMASHGRHQVEYFTENG